MFVGLGPSHAMFVLAGLATVHCGVAVLFARHGKRIRLRSKFAQHTAALEGKPAGDGEVVSDRRLAVESGFGHKSASTAKWMRIICNFSRFYFWYCDIFMEVYSCHVRDSPVAWAMRDLLSTSSLACGLLRNMLSA